MLVGIRREKEERRELTKKDGKDAQSLQLNSFWPFPNPSHTPSLQHATDIRRLPCAIVNLIFFPGE